jgi:hypothetical protein
MAYSTGSVILDDDYNIFATGNAAGTGDNNVANVNTVWGVGATDRGYGQTTLPVLSPVAAGQTVTATQWATMLNRISSAASHQGSSITPITNPVAGETISAYAALSTNITTIFNNRLNAAASGSTTTTNTDRTTSWVSSVTFTQTVTFSSADAARYFFNAGGRITVSYSRTGGSSNDQNTAITNLCTACGTLTFTAGTGTQTIAGGSFTGTTKTGGSGSPTIASTTGWYDLTTSNVQVFTQSASSYYGYEGNSITVNLRNATSGTQLVVASTVTKSGGLTTVDGTLRAAISVIPPSTTFLTTASWGTPSVSGSQSGS